MDHTAPGFNQSKWVWPWKPQEYQYEWVYQLSSGEVAGMFQRQNSHCAACLNIQHVWNTYDVCTVVPPHDQETRQQLQCTLKTAPRSRQEREMHVHTCAWGSCEYLSSWRSTEVWFCIASHRGNAAHFNHSYWSCGDTIKQAPKVTLMRRWEDESCVHGSLTPSLCVSEDTHTLLVHHRWHSTVGQVNAFSMAWPEYILNFRPFFRSSSETFPSILFFMSVCSDRFHRARTQVWALKRFSVPL